MYKVAIYTQGCSANQADSEVLKGLLVEAGYKLVKLSDADLVIFNTCSLKSPTEQSLFRKIRDLSDSKKIIIAGCFPLSFPNDSRLEKYSLLGSFDFKKVVEAVEKVRLGKRVVLLSRKGEEKLCLPRIRDNKKIAKIPISQGCLNACSFCAGKLARGDLISFNIEKITLAVESAVKSGCKKILLTSQDAGCYGMDCGSSLVELVERVISIPGDFKVRIGMMSPQWVSRMVPAKLIKLYKNEKIANFLHIPVQSGSNKILKAMNRQYSVEEFKNIVSEFREEIPNIYISTDLIVGFPGETETDFQRTVDLLRWLKPGFLNLTKYWPRKGTKAYDMKQLSRKVRKNRAKQVHEEFNKIKKK